MRAKRVRSFARALSVGEKVPSDRPAHPCRNYRRWDVCRRRRIVHVHVHAHGLSTLPLYPYRYCCVILCCSWKPVIPSIDRFDIIHDRLRLNTNARGKLPPRSSTRIRLYSASVASTVLPQRHKYQSQIATHESCNYPPAFSDSCAGGLGLTYCLAPAERLHGR